MHVGYLYIHIYVEQNFQHLAPLKYTKAEKRGQTRKHEVNRYLWLDVLQTSTTKTETHSMMGVCKKNIFLL